ncbi:MAG: hypothetical protein ACYDIA_00715 [Candidatus Humimicrobiaceae bacterium]
MRSFRKPKSKIEKNIKLIGIISAIVVASTTFFISWHLIDFDSFKYILHNDISEFIFLIIFSILGIFFLYTLVGIIFYLILFYLGSFIIYFFCKDPALKEEVRYMIFGDGDDDF